MYDYWYYYSTLRHYHNFMSCPIWQKLAFPLQLLYRATITLEVSTCCQFISNPSLDVKIHFILTKMINFGQSVLGSTRFHLKIKPRNGKVISAV